MKMLKILVILSVLGEALALNTHSALAAGLDQKAISQAAGTKTTVTSDGIVRISWERNDVPVKVDGVPLKPFAGLSAWAAFQDTPHGTMLMGDTVLFQDEVAPAMDAAFAYGLEVTALHNHFFYDEPKVYFMHIGGMGDAVQLAEGVKAVWDAAKHVRTDHATPAKLFPDKASIKEGKIDAASIEKIIGHSSETKEGVVKVTIAREGKMDGETVGGSMGLTTWVAFSGSQKYAAADGDIIMTAEEVQPVLRALRKANINIVALHNHMMEVQPPFYFLHFWAKGDVESLAKGFKSALDTQESGKL